MYIPSAHRVEREALISLQPVIKANGGGGPLDAVRELGGCAWHALADVQCLGARRPVSDKHTCVQRLLVSAL